MLRKIGIFDSGVGGLTVLKFLRKLLPYHSMIYLGDTARVPYGIRSADTIIRYSLQDVQFLLNQGAEVIVIACNSASSVGLEAVREFLKESDIPVLGVVEPGAKRALQRTQNRRIGVLGTPSTIRSEAYPKILYSLDKTVQVFQRACSLFVPLVEEGWLEGEIVLRIVRKYLDDFQRLEMDTLILGCTHYPLLSGVIREVVGEKMTLVDPSEAVASDVVALLRERGDIPLEKRQNFFSSQDIPRTIQYFVTDAPNSFKRVGEIFLEEKLDFIEKIVL